MTGPVGSCVYTVAKKCYECGTEWEGQAFTSQPEGAARLPGICAVCIGKDEARVRELTKPRIELAPSAETELEPPRPVGDGLDDVYPIDRKMLQAGER